MSDQLLKDIIKCKLKLLDAVITALPESIREPSAKFKSDLLQAVEQAIKETEKDGTGAGDNNKTGVQRINIE